MRIIGQRTAQLEQFLHEWESDSQWIEAHTSGSTGAPKPIRLLKSDMLQSAHNTCRFFNLDSHSVLALPLSVDYIAGKMMIVRAIAADCTLYVEQPSNHPLAYYPSDLGPIALLAIVPSQLPSLLERLDRYDIANAIIGGSALGADAENRALKAGLNAYCTYGMTETCSHVALRQLGRDCYTALTGIEFETDNRGCIVIKSQEFSFGTLTTNDVVDLISPSEFRWLGRADNVINSGGVKLHPEIIERKIEPILPNNAYYVTSRPSAQWGEELILMVESQNPIEDLEAKLHGVLNKIERPKAIFYQPQFHRTTSGKIIRK